MSALAELPKPFHANYKAQYAGLSVNAERSLTYLSNDQLQFEFSAKHWLARIEEASLLEWDVQQQRLIPQRYSYNRTGLAKDRHALLDFDWRQQQVTNNVQDKPWSMAVPEGVQDKLSYQLQLRADLLNQNQYMHYEVADGGRLKTYEFDVLGKEVLKTPLGRFNTVKVKRVRKDDKRETLLWLTPDWDYLIVKIQQTEDDGRYYEINLTSAEVDGTKVTGL